MTNTQAMQFIREHGHQAREVDGKVEAGILVLDTNTREEWVEWERLRYSRGRPTMMSLRNILGY